MSLNSAILQQRVGQCLKSVLFTEPHMKETASPFNSKCRGILIEGVWVVYPSDEQPVEQAMILMGGVPQGQVAEAIGHLLGRGMPDQDQDPEEPPVWQMPVQVLVNKAELNAKYGQVHFPEGTMELGKFIQAMILVIVQKRLTDIFRPARQPALPADKAQDVYEDDVCDIDEYEDDDEEDDNFPDEFSDLR